METKIGYEEQVLIQTILDQEISFSPAWEKFTGRSDLSDNWNEIIHPDDLEGLLRVCREVRSLKSPQHVKFKALSADGEYYPFLANVFPLIDEHGKLEGVCLNSLDCRESANIHFEDLERFLSYWSNDPDGFAHFVGWAIGRLIPHKLSELFLATGASYFSLKNICSRIEFLYEVIEKEEKLTIKDGKETHLIAHVYKYDNVLCIRAPQGQRIMFLRDILDGLSYYSIRYFVGPGEMAIGYLKSHWTSEWGRPDFATVRAALLSTTPPAFEEDHTFWNFRETDDIMRGVIVYPYSDGFSDPWETKRLGDLIVQVSNLRNFDRKLA